MKYLIFITCLIAIFGCDHSPSRMLIRELNLEIPVVKVYYIEPKTPIGIPIRPTVNSPKIHSNKNEDLIKIRKYVKEAQVFFASEMERHGYGRKTFLIDTNSDNEIIITTIKLRNDIDYYNSSYDAIELEIYDRLHCPHEISLFFINTDNPSNQPVSGFGSIRSCDVFNFEGKNSNPKIWVGSRTGFAYIYRNYWNRFEITWYNKVVWHELGHAFGLNHDFSDGELVMSYGYTKTENGKEYLSTQRQRSKISYNHSLILNKHPSFVLVE